MRQRWLACVLGFLLSAPAHLLSQEAADPELAKGVKQTQQGDFEGAIVTLDAVARRLSAQGGRPKELSRAFLYLSIAYLGMSQEQKAKAQFLEAWKMDQGMELSPKEFPPKVLEFFEQARKDAAAAAAPTPPPAPRAANKTEVKPSPDPMSAAGEPKRKGGGGKTALIVLGVGGAAAAGIAAAVARGRRRRHRRRNRQHCVSCRARLLPARRSRSRPSRGCSREQCSSLSQWSLRSLPTTPSPSTFGVAASLAFRTDRSVRGAASTA